MPRRTDAVKILFPSAPRLPIAGTMTQSPKNPYTTDGIPASKSTPGFIIL